ncbi:MAG: glycine C-acetyltransferase [Candidatus Izemoplasmatales bacterium]|nr:glycine C-acetyltransferase [Candidatus Izemoplasmatales bacterium]MDD4988210.1 glycine C-acetyltransferase [Candidatus Izemoplasmatales bacterium]MDY0372632.1 glycine C-acetyltransferase [Candidatus Izemoplasmatales bacterium]
MKKLAYIDTLVDGLKKEGVYRVLPINYGPCSNVIDLNHRSVVNLSSNNYLGLANHPRVKQKAIEAIEKYGVGAGSVRTIVGNQDLLETLENLLAEFKQEEAVVCFQSGLTCNLGTIPAIVQPGDLIISDSLNHASIIDGVRLAKADKAVYKHSDMIDLERILKEKREQYHQVIIITDGVFSMDGDLAKLPAIVKLAEQYNALVYVDDAHGSGVLGHSGRGTVDHFGLHGKIDFIVGTLSKAIGVVGGYVATKKNVKEWLLHRARPLLFSTAIPPMALGAIIESVKMLMESDEYTKKLWDNARYFKQGMHALGFDIGHSETPITPVMIGEEAKTMAFSKALLDEGVFVSGIVFPTVPLGTGRLRVMISAMHEKKDLDFALEAFAKVGRRMNIIL